MDVTGLINQSKLGDVRAFGQLVAAFEAYVLSICRYFVNAEGQGDDVAQDVFLTAFRSIGQLQDPRKFRQWLKRLTVNRCLDELRKSRHYLVSPLDELSEQDFLQAWAKGDADERDALEREILLYSSLHRLSTPDRHLLTLFYLHDLSIDQISTILCISASAAKKRLERARKSLSKEIRTMTRKHREPALSAQVVELLSRPSLIEAPSNPVSQLWADIRSYLTDFKVVDGEEIIQLDEHRPFRDDPHNVIKVDDRQALRSQTTTATLDYIQQNPHNPCRIMAAGRVWRDDEENSLHRKMFHQLDVLTMGEDVREGDLIPLATDLIDHLISDCRRVRWESRDFHMTKRCWSLYVEANGNFSEVAAGGEFKTEVLIHYGVNPRRFRALGIGFGLERLAMVRYGIRDIRLLQGQEQTSE